MITRFKTFEKMFIDIFKKHKKLPQTVIHLGDKLVNFVKKVNDDKDDVYYNIHNFNDKNNMTTMSVIIYRKNTNTIHNIIRLYFNESTKSIMISLIEKYYYKDIREYIINILENRSYSQKLNSRTLENCYFIKLYNVEDFINDLDLNDFNLFIQTKKYNL